jgi:hypothetical protein
VRNAAKVLGAYLRRRREAEGAYVKAPERKEKPRKGKVKGRGGTKETAQ